MKKHRSNLYLAALLLIGAVLLMSPQGAMAAGTSACTAIGNTASVVYSVGSVTQSALSTGTTATFVVGSKVNLTVSTSDSAPVTVAPGASGTSAALTYRVRNDGNATQRYTLSAVVYSTGSTTSPFSPYTASDNFDATAYQVYVDTGSGYSLTSQIDSLVSDATATVQIRANPIALTQANNDFAVYGLHALTINTDGSALVSGSSGTGDVFNAAGATVCSGVDIVNADIDTDGAETNDGDRDGAALSKSAFLVQTVGLLVSKSSGTPVDLFGGSAAIPGSTVEYTIRVSRNSGGASATGVVITDTVAGTLAPVADAYPGSTEVQRITYDAGTTTTTTTNLASGDADLQSWATTAGATVQVSCGAFALDENGDYCEIKFKVIIQ
ncbi:MAG: hypothetical protein OEW15_16485 [Nitrospirota bacterium]|nr:hypothetical protein [Nitrospirota bacterium]